MARANSVGLSKSTGHGRSNSDSGIPELGREAELAELRKGARGKLSAAAFDAFVSDLVNGRWLELGDDGEVAYGPRAILELADVLRGHGAEVPQMVYY